MKEIKLKDKTFRLSMPETDILACIKKVADSINADYAGRKPLFLPVLNGSFMFASDLLKDINLECEVCFVKMSSYEGTASTGKVKELIGITRDITGRDIIIVEDIVESGQTIMEMKNLLANHNPASVKVCTLFFKPTKLISDLKVDYAAKIIPDDFIVGHGLDYDQLGRNLRDLYTIAE